MTIFEQFIATYFLSATTLACFGVLVRNWLQDHPQQKKLLVIRLGNFSKIITCGSCLTLWITLMFVLAINPLQNFLLATPSFVKTPIILLYFIQWMSIGWGALFMRFSYIALQEIVSVLVHRFHDHRS